MSAAISVPGRLFPFWPSWTLFRLPGAYRLDISSNSRESPDLVMPVIKQAVRLTQGNTLHLSPAAVGAIATIYLVD